MMKIEFVAFKYVFNTRRIYVDEAVDGAEALEKANENDYACILLDQ